MNRSRSPFSLSEAVDFSGSVSPMLVSFVVPMHDGAATIGAALDSILAQAEGLDGVEIEVIVVDDGSRDAGAEVVRRRSETDARITLLTRPNGGEAAALNTGRARAQGDLVAFVEADVVLSPRWLRVLRPEVSRPGIAGVGGRLVLPRGEPWAARLAGYEVEIKMGLEPREVPHVTSAAALYRWTALAAAGPFREDLLNASLDSELNSRLLRLGWRLRYAPEAIAWHRYKPTFGAYLKRVYAYARYRTATGRRWLYPADRWVAARLGWLLFLPVAVFLSSSAWGWGAIAIGGALLHLPVVLRAGRFYKDYAVALASPFAGIARDAVAIVGLLAGWIAPADGGGR